MRLRGCDGGAGGGHNRFWKMWVWKFRGLFRPQVSAAPNGPIALGGFASGLKYPRTSARAIVPRNLRCEPKWGSSSPCSVSPAQASSSELQVVEALLETVDYLPASSSLPRPSAKVPALAYPEPPRTWGLAVDGSKRHILRRRNKPVRGGAEVIGWAAEFQYTCNLETITPVYMEVVHSLISSVSACPEALGRSACLEALERAKVLLPTIEVFHEFKSKLTTSLFLSLAPPPFLYFSTDNGMDNVGESSPINTFLGFFIQRTR